MHITYQYVWGFLLDKNIYYYVTIKNNIRELINKKGIEYIIIEIDFENEKDGDKFVEF